MGATQHPYIQSYGATAMSTIRNTFKTVNLTLSSTLDATTKLVTAVGSSVDILSDYIDHAKDNQKINHKVDNALRKDEQISRLATTRMALREQLSKCDQEDIDYALEVLKDF